MSQFDPGLFQEHERNAPRTDARQYLSLGPGFGLPDVQVAFETWGTLNEDRSNAILIEHALSGDSHAIGWWSALIGSGKPIDTDRYFVIGHNVLGGCQGSSGPATLDDAGRRLGSRFGSVTVEQMVDAQEKLVEHLGINHLLCVAGGSMGGMLTLEWARRSQPNAPIRVKKAFVTASALAHSAMQIAFNETARQAIFRDPNWVGGDFHQETPPRDGLAIGRMVGHLSYLSSAAFDSKFGRRRQAPRNVDRGGREKVFEVESYLSYQGDKFNDRFDAGSLVVLSEAIDGYCCESLAGSTTEFLVVSFTSDWIYPSELSRAIHEEALASGCRSEWHDLTLNGGHDSFLLDGDVQGVLLTEFLAR